MKRLVIWSSVALLLVIGGGILVVRADGARHGWGVGDGVTEDGVTAAARLALSLTS